MKNREIKFRAWDNVNKCFARHATYFDSEGNLYADLDPHGIDMSGKLSIGISKQYEFAGQFTGFTDKKGRDVYEGDIYTETIEGDFGDTYSDQICTFILPYCSFAMLGKDEYKEYLEVGIKNFDEAFRYSYLMNDYDFELVVYRGNIYENPELLTAPPQ
jgi:hypothetical protein